MRNKLSTNADATGIVNFLDRAIGLYLEKNKSIHYASIDDLDVGVADAVLSINRSSSDLLVPRRSVVDFAVTLIQQYLEKIRPLISNWPALQPRI